MAKKRFCGNPKNHDTHTWVEDAKYGREDLRFECEGVSRSEVKEEVKVERVLPESYTPVDSDPESLKELGEFVGFGKLATDTSISWTGSEVRTTSSTGGEKGVKPQRYDLIPIHPLNQLATLYGNGAAKYAAHNFRKGYEWGKSYAAALRHMTAFWNGEDIDPEMQVPHVICAAFHMFALAEFMEFHKEFDDRFKREELERLKEENAELRARLLPDTQSEPSEGPYYPQLREIDG